MIITYSQVLKALAEMNPQRRYTPTTVQMMNYPPAGRGPHGIAKAKRAALKRRHCEKR